MLLLLLSLAHAELWGGTNATLAAEATLIARASAEQGRWTAVAVVRGDLARMPAEASVEDGEYLVVCDALMCPRAVGEKVQGGWVLRGRELMNGAVISPGVVADGEESSLGHGPDCVRTGGVHGQTFAATGLAGERHPLRVWDGRGPELSASLGEQSLSLYGELALPGPCWVLDVARTEPPLRGAADLAHFEASAEPLLWGRGSLDLRGLEREAALWVDEHGQLLLEVDGAPPVPPHGARSMPKQGGTRWMFPVDGEILEIAVPPREGRADAAAVAALLAEGAQRFAVYAGDGQEAVGELALAAE